MDYELLDGSVVSIDTPLNDGIIADDLNVSSYEVTLETKTDSNGPALLIRNLSKHKTA